MLDTIPTEFWGESYKICDDGYWVPFYPKVFEPCSGKGGFIIDIISRLMNGLKENIPNEKLRYKTIVEECIYFSDINSTNIFICKLLIDPENEYNLNYNEGDTLELDITEKWNIKKFDCIITNPPYNVEDVTKHSSKMLYHKFINKFINLTKFMVYVIPSRWFSGGKGLDSFRESMRNRKDIKLIKHVNNSKIWFSNVDIQGGCCYFLKDANYEGLCYFNGIPYDLSKYKCIINPKYHIIADFVIGLENISELYRCTSYFKYISNDVRLQDTGKTKCYVSYIKSKSRFKFVNDYEPTEKKSFWKVITPNACGIMTDGFGYMMILNPDEIYTGSYISFKVDSEFEAKSLMSYLKSTFVNYILCIRKVSQHISLKVCEWVPLVPFDRIWTDELIYKYFNLTKTQINIIKNDNIIKT